MDSVSDSDSWASTPGVARSMRSNRRRDTRPELAVRRILHAAGYRYRVDFTIDPSNRRRKVDMAFTRARLAVFIDGCFWHGCPLHATIPVRNREYWEPKLQRNIKRDRATTESLEHLGWTVIRVWEHTPPAEAAMTISSKLDHLRDVRPSSRLDHQDRQTEESGSDG